MSLASRISDLATRIATECNSLWTAVNGKAATSHTHSYEPANANIQSHISDTPKHIDWTDATQDFQTDGKVTVGGSAQGIVSIVGSSSGQNKIVEFYNVAARLGFMGFIPTVSDMLFNVNTNNVLRLKTTGQLQAHSHGSGTFTGTKAYYAAFDSSGNIIEFSTIPFTDISGTDNAITLAKLAADLKTVVSLTGTAIDWSAGVEFYKTLSGTTTLTDTNLVKGKVIVLRLTGNYSITFPAYWNIMKGSETYDGTITNTITIHCIETSAALVEYYINQRE